MRRALLVIVALAALGGLVAWSFLRAPPSSEASRPPAPLVAAIRSEPRTFNRLVATDRGSLLVTLLTQGRLVQLNHRTGEIEPALAERWTLAPDQRTYTLELRRDVRFSDGAPFTADDVTFTFQALYDPKVASPLARSLMVEGAPIDVRKSGTHTVVLTFPAPYGPGLRVLNSVPILPAHKLRPALDASTFRTAWGISTPPAELTGLGPFMISSYAAGDRLELVRNPRYWADGSVGERPRVDRLVLRVVPNQSAELLRLEAGELDLLSGEVRPDDIAAVRKLAAAGRVQVFELGPAVDADSLWFNLVPDARRPASERPWLDARFRRAISHAVDRQAFVDTVLLGAGTPLYGPITPGNAAWHTNAVPRDEFAPEKTRALLAELGIRDHDGDGRLELRPGKNLRFELLSQRGNATRERATAVLEADLEKAGMDVDVVLLDAPALGERLMKGAYDAAYFAVVSSDTDPSANLDFWVSSGAFHFWHPGQAKPATPWEREMDLLMQEITSLTDHAERRGRFERVQQIFAAERPAIYFAAPTVVVAASARVTGVEPAVIYPFVLWRPDTIGTR